MIHKITNILSVIFHKKYNIFITSIILVINNIFNKNIFLKLKSTITHFLTTLIVLIIHYWRSN